MDHASLSELEDKLNYILNSPKSEGILKQIVRRPDIDQREVLQSGELSFSDGLEGDSWKYRGSRRTEDGSSHPDMQINIMNARIIELIAKDESRWALAGDQLYIDIDLSPDNLPPGSKLKIGDAELMITEQPHTGCGKFKERFGSDALKFINSAYGKENNFRGVNARVTKEGKINSGDAVFKI